MSNSTKKTLEALESRIAALECVGDSNSNFLILKREIQSRMAEDKASFAALKERVAELGTTDPLRDITEHIRVTDYQHIVARLDALESALKASDSANRALWKKLLYGVQRQS